MVEVGAPAPSGVVVPLATSGEVVALGADDEALCWSLSGGADDGESAEGVWVVAAAGGWEWVGVPLVPVVERAVPSPPVAVPPPDSPVEDAPLAGIRAVPRVSLLDELGGATFREAARAAGGSPDACGRIPGIACPWSPPSSDSCGNGPAPIRPAASAASHAASIKPKVVVASRPAWSRRRPSSTKTGCPSVEASGSNIAAGIRCVARDRGGPFPPGDDSACRPQDRVNLSVHGPVGTPVAARERLA
jgi:hypothetical protein